LVQIVVLVVLYHKYSHPGARQQQWKWPTKIEQLMYNKVFFGLHMTSFSVIRRHLAGLSQPFQWRSLGNFQFPDFVLKELGLIWIRLLSLTKFHQD
jgi:hypothetical protein